MYKIYFNVVEMMQDRNYENISCIIKQKDFENVYNNNIQNLNMQFKKNNTIVDIFWKMMKK